MRTPGSSCDWRHVLAGVALVGATAIDLAAAEPRQAPTFTKDIVPIFQEKCLNCHRPGAMAPMSLVTYDDVRPWARSIRRRVSNREMPPWALNRHVGVRDYKDDMSLTEAQIATVVAWIDAGSPRGNPADAPPPRTFPDPKRWEIGEPDLVVTANKEIAVEAEGFNWWVDMEMSSGLTEDRWIKAVEFRPGDPRVVHHINLIIIPPDDAEIADLPPGASPPEGQVGSVGKTIDTYTPGKPPLRYESETGILLKKGSRIRFGMHYASIGEVVRDRSAVGFIFYPRDYVPKKELHNVYFNLVTEETDIPPHSIVSHDVYFHLSKPTRLENWSPHMHERGKAMSIEAILPNGRRQVLSFADRYDFGWQLIYSFADHARPLLPAGTMLHLVTTHDNTQGNRRNPDPAKWVGWGQSSTDEMAGAFITYVELTDDEFRAADAARQTADASRSPRDQ